MKQKENCTMTGTEIRRTLHAGNSYVQAGRGVASRRGQVGALRCRALFFQCVISVALTFSAAAAPEVCTWTGKGADSSWHNADNWDKGVPVSGVIAAFTNAVTVQVNPDGSTYSYSKGPQVSGFRISGGNVTLKCGGSDTRIRFFASGESDDCFVDVAEGCVFLINNGSPYGYATDGADLVKTGCGEFYLNFVFGTGIKDLEIREGVFRYNNDYPGSGTITGRYIVRNGATLINQATNNRMFFGDGKVVQVDKGGTVNLSGMTGAGRGASYKVYFAGEGDIINIGSSSNYFVFNGENDQGELTDFTGTFNGYVAWKPTKAEINQAGIRFNMGGGQLKIPADTEMNDVYIDCEDFNGQYFMRKNEFGQIVQPFVEKQGPFQIVIKGGHADFEGGLFPAGQVTVLQTGGLVTADPMACTRGTGVYSEREMPYVMSGGHLVSRGNQGFRTYSFGADLSGDAVCDLIDGPAAYGPHTMSYSSGIEYRIRLRDQALVNANNLHLAGYGPGSGATIELAGGTLSISNVLGFHTDAVSLGRIPADFAGRIIFDGGVLQSPKSGSYRWPLPAGYQVSDANFTTYVRAGGGTFDLPYESISGALDYVSPIVSDVEGGKDGGIRLTGNGKLNLSRMVTIAGPVAVDSGRLANSVADQSAFGTGDIRIGCGELVVGNSSVTVVAASDDGAALTYGNGATLGVTGKGIAIGGLRREGHGVLFVAQDGFDAAFGTGTDIKVDGGVANNPVTGLIAQPVFAETPTAKDGSTKTAGVLGFVAYDSQNGIVRSPATAGIPVDSSEQSVCEVFGERLQLDRNARVGALAVYGPSSKGFDGGLEIANGATLTIGNGAGTIAPLLINNLVVEGRQRDGTGACTIQGGTIDFGAAEGVIAMNARYLNIGIWDPMEIGSTLAGSGGITFASSWTDTGASSLRAIDILGANTYSGGTWVENTSVRISQPTGFGQTTGAVTAEGNSSQGGRVVIRADYSGDTFGYPLVLSGVGPQATRGVQTGTKYQYVSPAEDGAFAAQKSVAVVGGVTLAGDARIFAGGAATLDVQSVISGRGTLEICGSGIVRFSANNTYDGLTVVNGATLEVSADGRIPGVVQLMNGAKIRFVGCLKPDGLEIRGDGDIEYASLSGDGDFVKDDEGDTLMSGTSDYAGATVVNAGTLHLGPYAGADELPFASQVTLRFDATKVDTMVRTGDQLVTKWSDADGRSRDVISANNASAPIYDADAFSGMGGVRFASDHVTALRNTEGYSSTCCDVGSIFAVIRVGDADSAASRTWNETPLLGWFNWVDGIRQPQGIRIAGPGKWAHTELCEGAQISVDGERSDDFVFGKDMALGVTMASQAYIPISLGELNLTYDNINDAFSGVIGEVIAYSRPLGSEESMLVEQYLMRKWNVSGAKRQNVLPATTTLSVAGGAALDLAGAEQALASMDVSGGLYNSTETLAKLILNQGVSDIREGASVDGTNLYLRLNPGAKIDLHGGTLTVDYFKGDKTDIINGQFQVRIRDYGVIGGTVITVR